MPVFHGFQNLTRGEQGPGAATTNIKGIIQPANQRTVDTDKLQIFAADILTRVSMATYIPRIPAFTVSLMWRVRNLRKTQARRGADGLFQGDHFNLMPAARHHRQLTFRLNH